MAIRRKGVGLGTILLGMEIKSQFLSQQSSRVLCSGAAHLCLSAICARTWASTLVGSCIASEPNTRIRLLIRTGGREGRGGEGRLPTTGIAVVSAPTFRLRFLHEAELDLLLLLLLDLSPPLLP